MQSIRLSLILALFSALAATANEQAELATLGNRLASAFVEQDHDYLTKTFDRDAFRELYMRGPERTNPQALAFDKGVGNNLLAMISGRLPCTSAKYLRSGLDQDDQLRVLLRVVSADAGVVYLYLYVKKSADQWRVVDLYNVTQGVRVSNMLRRSLMATLLVGRDGKPEDSDMGKQMMAMQEAIQLSQQGKHAQAYKQLRAIKSSKMVDKMLYLLRLQAAMRLDEDAYAKELGLFLKKFPDDPSVDLMGIDYHLANERYSEAIGCIDRLDKLIGGDHYLLLLRGNVAFMAGDYDKAVVDLTEVIKHEPELVDAYDSLFTAHCSRGKFDKAVALLPELEKRLGQQLDLASLDPELGFADFAKSPQYQAFREKFPIK